MQDVHCLHLYDIILLGLRKNYINTRFFLQEKKSGVFLYYGVKESKNRKEIPIMKSNSVKKQTAKALANVSLKLGKMSADSACCFIYHQPTMPEALKKMKKD